MGELLLVPVIRPLHHLQASHQPVPLLLYGLHLLQQSVVYSILQGVSPRVRFSSFGLFPAEVIVGCTNSLNLPVRGGSAIPQLSVVSQGVAGSGRLWRSTSTSTSTTSTSSNITSNTSNRRGLCEGGGLRRHKPLLPQLGYPAVLSLGGRVIIRFLVTPQVVVSQKTNLKPGTESFKRQ